MVPIIIGAIMAGMSALSSFSSFMQQGAQQRQQAAVMTANAKVARENARQELERGRVEAWQQDREKSRLRREYEEKQGLNRIALGAGNVDMSSGSALDVSLGNASLFAEDMADNAYAVAMRKWEANEKARQYNAQANILDSNASYLQQSAANIGSSLLTASLAGGGSFFGGYSMAGGSFGNLFGMGGGGGGGTGALPGVSSAEQNSLLEAFFSQVYTK